MVPSEAYCGSCGAARQKTSTPAPGLASTPTGAVRDTGAEIGTLAVIGAGAGLILLLAGLVFLASVVRDANAEARETRVLAGNVSVIGSAKVRDWSAAPFSVQLPADWGNIATGATVNPATGTKQEGIVKHVWEGTLDGTGSTATCDPKLPCFSVRIDRVGDQGTLTDAKRAALIDQGEARARSGYLYRDLGPVTALGGRWAWRWIYDQDGREHVDYFFRTCAAGRPAAVWSVKTDAPAGAYPYVEFANALASLRTTERSEPATGGCAETAAAS